MWELDLRKGYLEEQTVETIYLGGGTPSLLNIGQLNQLIDSVKEKYRIAQEVEFTMECNPEDVTSEGLQHWRDAGINRLSIGIQSFRDHDLRFMNRVHNADQSLTALELIDESPIENYNVDLMFGLVDSTLEDWQYSLEKISQFQPTHLSVYNLTIEEQTVFAHLRKTKRLEENTTEEQRRQFRHAQNYLAQKGFQHYEISNYSLPGYSSLHNANYWKRIPYLGIGPSAHSFQDEVRSWNVSNNASYLRMCEQDEYYCSKEHLDQFDQYNETIMLGLRCDSGIDITKLSLFPTEIRDHFYRESEHMMKEGILISTDQSIRLNKDWWFICDKVSSGLFITKN